MRDVIIQARNTNTNSIVTINLSDLLGDVTDRLFATPQGLFFIQKNGENEDFTDIVPFSRLKRKEHEEWVEYIIKQYRVNGKAYKFVKNRNLYNRNDKPIIVEVEEF